MHIGNSSGDQTMTTFVSHQLTGASASVTPTVDSGRLTHLMASVREWSRDYARAFRASADAPRRAGMDPAALMMFGRD
jgi:hypothetical protein